MHKLWGACRNIAYSIWSLVIPLSLLTDEQWDLYTLNELAEELPLANCRGSSKNQPFRCGSFPKFHRSWCVYVPSLQSCLTLCKPVDCSLPGTSVHEILQARILEWVAISSSKGSSQPRDWTRISWVSWCLEVNYMDACNLLWKAPQKWGGWMNEHRPRWMDGWMESSVEG